MYTTEKGHFKTIKTGRPWSHDRQAYDRVFAELVTFEMEAYRSSEGGNVFRFDDKKGRTVRLKRTPASFDKTQGTASRALTRFASP